MRPHLRTVRKLPVQFAANPLSAGGWRHKHLRRIPINSGDTHDFPVLTGDDMAVAKSLVGEPVEERLGQRGDAIMRGSRLCQRSYFRTLCRMLWQFHGFKGCRSHAYHPSADRNRRVTTIKIPRRIARPAVALLSIGGVLGAAWLADSAVAMRAEHNLSQAVKDTSQLGMSPSVYIGGMPYTLAALTNEIPLVEVHTLDVEIPEMGLVNAATTLRDLDVSTDQVWSGNLEGAHVSTLSRSISLDGVALGRVLDMTDLAIANTKDISPSGGVASEAELTGTIPGADHKATVVVTLRLVGPEFRMIPQQVTDLPEGLSEQQVKDAFTLTFDTHKLPLPGQATSVKLMGGSISFETQRFNTDIRIADLSPIEIEGDFEEDGTEKDAAN